MSLSYCQYYLVKMKDNKLVGVGPWDSNKELVPIYEEKGSFNLVGKNKWHKGFVPLEEECLASNLPWFQQDSMVSLYTCRFSDIVCPHHLSVVSGYIPIAIVRDFENNKFDGRILCKSALSENTYSKVRQSSCVINGYPSQSYVWYSWVDINSEEYRSYMLYKNTEIFCSSPSDKENLIIYAAGI